MKRKNKNKEEKTDKKVDYDILDNVDPQLLYEVQLELAEEILDEVNGTDKKSIEDYAAVGSLLKSSAERGINDCLWHYLTARLYYGTGKLRNALEELEWCDENGGLDEDGETFLRVCVNDINSLGGYYTEYEHDMVLDYITKKFGRISMMLPDPERTRINTEIAVIDPTKTLPWKLLVTVGMGANRMKIPEIAASYSSNRIELVMYLDPQSSSNSVAEACLLLREISKMPSESGEPILHGQLYSYDKPIFEGMPYKACMIVDPLVSCRGSFENMSLDEDNEDDVYFLVVIPLHEDEADYRRDDGPDELIKRLHGSDWVLKPNRPNRCAGYVKAEEIKIYGEMIDRASELGIGKYCMASKYIPIDGEEVMIMVRVFPELLGEYNSEMSGWMFFTKEEGPTVFVDPSSLRLEEINKVCSIDPGIIPYLTMPYGTKLIRRYRGGEFIPMKDDTDRDNDGRLPS